MTVNVDVKKTLDALGERRVVNVGESGNSWFREWSDGWIEQGGKVSRTGVKDIVTLPKAYSNTHYNITFGVGHNNSEINLASVTVCSEQKTGSFVALVGSAANFAYWRTEGY